MIVPRSGDVLSPGLPRRAATLGNGSSQPSEVMVRLDPGEREHSRLRVVKLQ